MDHNADMLEMDINFKIQDTDDNMETSSSTSDAPDTPQTCNLQGSFKQESEGAKGRNIKRSSCKAAGSNILVLM